MNAVYQLRITLKNVRPPIWRQVQVPMDFRLDQLHTLIHLVMGWDDYHLHEFELAAPGRARWPERRFMPAEAMAVALDDEAEDESTVSIGELCPQVNDKLVYTYDFGDDWIHEVKVQKILSAEPGENYPLCLKGKRACPPEDCGGPWGYENLLAILSNPGHEEYEEMLDWIGGDFDPEKFDLEGIAEDLRGVKW
jgi:hypothetical protein